MSRTLSDQLLSLLDEHAQNPDDVDGWSKITTSTDDRGFVILDWIEYTTDNTTRERHWETSMDLDEFLEALWRVG